MSGWRHRVCADCWAKSNPERMPVMVLNDDESVCCKCGGVARSGGGIYIRAEPMSLKCQGKGPEHEASEP